VRAGICTPNLHTRVVAYSSDRRDQIVAYYPSPREVQGRYSARLYALLFSYSVVSTSAARYHRMFEVLLLLLYAVTHAPFHAPVLRPTSWPNARNV